VASAPLRVGTAFVGVAGAILLAGCSTTAEPQSEAPADGAEYKDGTYTAEGSYQTHETVETVSVTMTLADGVVEEVEVTGDPQASETELYQGQFIDGIAAEVEGKPIDELQVDKVAGSSLTSGGFNKAVEDIKAQAAE
jgi:uncharacterized protein with FMN-binding domain